MIHIRPPSDVFLRFETTDQCGDRGNESHDNQDTQGQSALMDKRQELRLQVLHTRLRNLRITAYTLHTDYSTLGSTDHYKSRLTRKCLICWELFCDSTALGVPKRVHPIPIVCANQDLARKLNRTAPSNAATLEKL